VSPHPGHFLVGTLGGVAKFYVHEVDEFFRSLVVYQVYKLKMPITARDLLSDRVLPFYEAFGVELGAVLTDNGRESCGRATTPTRSSWRWTESSRGRRRRRRQERGAHRAPSVS
jgi:hypothetical protein